PPGPEILWACLAAAFGTSGLVAFYRGMAAGAISVVAPISGTAAVVPVLWALAHGEHPSGLQELGFVLVLGGVVATSWERTPGRARITAGAGWAALALVAFGGYYVPMHAASRHDFLWASLVFRSTSTTIVWLTVLALGRRPRGRGAGFRRLRLRRLDRPTADRRGEHDRRDRVAVHRERVDELLEVLGRGGDDPQEVAPLAGQPVALDHLRHLLDGVAEPFAGVRAPRRDHDERAEREAERSRIDLRRVRADRPFLLESAQTPPN